MLTPLGSARCHGGERSLTDQYYPAHKAETDQRFAQINRRLHASEISQALDHARAAGLWRLDTRRRNTVPHGRAVWLPVMQEREQTRRV